MVLGIGDGPAPPDFLDGGWEAAEFLPVVDGRSDPGGEVEAAHDVRHYETIVFFWG